MYLRGRVFVLVEGNKDTWFVSSVVYSLLKNKYRQIRPLKCSEVKDEVIEKEIRVSKKIGSCLFIRDMDDSPCTPALKSKILAKFKDLDMDDVHIVVKEIESWYLAGANSSIEKWLKVKLDDIDTNTVTKEVFLSLKPEGMTQIEFYGMFLKNFDVEKAKARNESFSRFVSKCAP